MSADDIAAWGITPLDLFDTEPRRLKVAQTKHAAIMYSQLQDDLFDELRARVDINVEQISSYLRIPPPDNIKVVLSDLPRKSVTYHESGVIIIAKSRIPNKMALAHELTHLIAGRSSDVGGLLDEGLAVYLQERFGGQEDRSFPTWGRDLHEETLRAMHKCNFDLTLAETTAVRQTDAHSPRRTLAYLQEGSFVRFLTERQRIDTVMQVYTGAKNWIEAFGVTFSALETEWRARLAHISVRVHADLALSGRKP